MIANAVLRATGYAGFTRRLSPHSSLGTPDALILGAPGFFEVLCRGRNGNFDVKDSNGDYITSVAKVTTPPENKRAVIGAFLDLNRVEEKCAEHGITFIGRVMYVNRFTLRLVGRQIKHGEGRKGYPVISQIDQRKKAKPKKLDSSSKWRTEFLQSKISIQDLEMEAEAAKVEVSEVEKNIRS
ncbi:hypothetical protein BGZ99_003378, partial [Dissophora globulifera]